MIGQPVNMDENTPLEFVADGAHNNCTPEEILERRQAVAAMLYMPVEKIEAISTKNISFVPEGATEPVFVGSLMVAKCLLIGGVTYIPLVMLRGSPTYDMMIHVAMTGISAIIGNCMIPNYETPNKKEIN